MGLRLAGLPTLEAFGFTTAIAVVAVMFTALCWCPPLGRFAASGCCPAPCAAAGCRTEGVRCRALGADGSPPAPAVTVAAASVMLVLAAPVLDMRTWPQDPGRQSSDTTTRRAFDLISAEIGAGANTPLLVVVDPRAGRASRASRP